MDHTWEIIAIIGCSLPKGEWKKAVSAYQDVLFFLKRDHIPDEEQADQMAEIQAKIEEMQKYLEESKSRKNKEKA